MKKLISHFLSCTPDHYVGNMAFRELVSSYKSVYDANNDETFRRNLAIDIVRQLRPGRFLKMHSTNYFRVVDYESSVTKVR